jgi:erythrocyte band 7 integral membrane protein
VHISDIQIKDIIVPPNIMNLLSSAATAEREATAKIINARADVSAAELMKKAADMLNSDAAMQIRHLEVMRQLAESSNAKIIFMPTDAKTMETMKQTMVAQEVLE